MTIQTRQVPKTVQEDVLFLVCDGPACANEAQVAAPQKYLSVGNTWIAFPDGYVLARTADLMANAYAESEYLNFCCIECVSAWALQRALRASDGA